MPGVFRNRPLALRGFDADGMLIDAELTDWDGLRVAIERQFCDPKAAYLHVHNARPGCYAARIDRA